MYPLGNKRGHNFRVPRCTHPKPTSGMGTVKPVATPEGAGTAAGFVIAVAMRKAGKC